MTMYLSADRLALANQKALETFEHCSIAWQVIPHWDTGDPGQTQVRNDVLNDPDFLPLVPESDPFELTLAQTSAPTPDSLIAEVMASAATLAKKVDLAVLQKLYSAAITSPQGPGQPQTPAVPLELKDPFQLDQTLAALIKARAYVEDAGYRAPSCLVANNAGLVALSDISTGYPATEGLLAAANANSMHRSSKIDQTQGDALTILFIGRRQLIPHCCAADASPGEEPIDLAVSVMPGVEVIGETKAGTIKLAVRISYALRVKDPEGVAAITSPPPKQQQGQQ